MTKLTIGQKLTLDGTEYKVVGIDSYTLTNIYEKEKTWDSYTLVDDKGKRIWVGGGITENALVKMWLTTEEDFKKATEKLPLNQAYTGIANITFQGEQGYSVPTSEIVWYNDSNEEHDFFIVERFLERDGEKLKASKSYYHIAKIVKD